MGKRATLAGTVLAEATDTVAVEGNAYFPPEAVKWDHLVPSDHTTVCGWKGVANYYDAVIDGHTHRNVA